MYKKLDSSLESIGNELSKLGDDIDAKGKTDRYDETGIIRGEGDREKPV